MVVVDGDRGLDGGDVDILVDKLHVAGLRDAIGVHGDVHPVSAGQLIAADLAALRGDDVVTLRQQHLLEVQGPAVLVHIVHGHPGLRRGGIVIIEDHGADAGGAIGVDRHIHGRIARGDVSADLAALGVHHMAAWGQEDLLEIQLLAADVHVHHRQGDLRHGRGGGHLGGNGGGGCVLPVEEGHLVGTGIAVPVHGDVHPIGAHQLVTRRGAGAGPDRCGLPCPALGILGVQDIAALGDVIDPHLHRIGLEALLPRHVDGGDVQQDGHIRLHAVHRIEQDMGVFIINAQRVHLRHPGEGQGLVAPVVQHVEGIRRIGGNGLHRQRLPDGRRIQPGPVIDLPVGVHLGCRHGVVPAAAVRPGEVEDRFIPEIRRISGGKTGGNQHHHRQHKGCNPAAMRAIKLHGMSLLRKMQTHIQYILYPYGGFPSIRFTVDFTTCICRNPRPYVEMLMQHQSHTGGPP